MAVEKVGVYRKWLEPVPKRNGKPIPNRVNLGKPDKLHDLRRSTVTNWAKQLPIQVVQQLAGHSDITTTTSKYYLAVRSEDLASAKPVVEQYFGQDAGRLTQN